MGFLFFESFEWRLPRTKSNPSYQDTPVDVISLGTQRLGQCVYLAVVFPCLTLPRPTMHLVRFSADIGKHILGRAVLDVYLAWESFEHIRNKTVSNIDMLFGA